MPYDIIYMWNLKYDTNKFIYKTEIVTGIGQACGSPGGGGMEEGQIESLGLADANSYIQNG